MYRRIRQNGSKGTRLVTGNARVMDIHSALENGEIRFPTNRDLFTKQAREIAEKPIGPDQREKIETPEKLREVMNAIDFSNFPMKFTIDFNICRCSICENSYGRDSVNIIISTMVNERNNGYPIAITAGRILNFPFTVRVLIEEIREGIKQTLSHEVDESLRYNGQIVKDPHAAEFYPLRK